MQKGLKQVQLLLIYIAFKFHKQYLCFWLDWHLFLKIAEPSVDTWKAKCQHFSIWHTKNFYGMPSVKTQNSSVNTWKPSVDTWEPSVDT